MVRSWSEDLHINLRFISAEFGALDLCPKLVSAQYLVKELMGLGSYFAYMLLLTTPSLVLSHNIFGQFSEELLTLIIGQKRYRLNIL